MPPRRRRSGTAGSVRNAMDELDERFLVISGDVLTDIDLAAVVEFHEAKAALATIGLKAMENPLEFGIVITRDDGSIERFLEKPTWGQVFSDTINTGIYVLEPEIFDYIARRPVGGLLGEVFPAVLDDGRAPLRLRRRGLLGGRRHPRRLHQGPPGRPRRQVRGGHPRIPSWGAGSGWERAPRSIRRATVDGPALIGDYCRVEAGGACWASTPCSAPTCGSAPTPSSSARWCTTTPIWARASARGMRSSAGRATCAGARARGGRGARRRVLRRRARRHQPGRQGLPVQDGRAGAIVNSSIVWESRGRPQPVRAARRGRPGQCRHLPGAGGAAGHGVRHAP